MSHASRYDKKIQRNVQNGVQCKGCAHPVGVIATGTRAFLRRFSSSAEHRRFRDAKPKNSPDDPRAPCKKSAQIRRAPSVSRREDKIGKEKASSCQGFRTPLCAGIRCGCGTAAERKASPKPEGFGGVRIGNYDTKRKTSIDDGGFLLVHLQGFEPGTH